ncbi:hypothetical protein [Chryseolinea soli]|uniref:Uncharacterized protein n=1 Tax=Chryseolinea soli TaxID=2321403 RepID=A0A385SXK6_9BACT|nr:hypothetical protein [Chryseolinea soli]AYB34817.1 hypothetical protein D4L85_31425 [Chryseolinea soli]
MTKRRSTGNGKIGFWQAIRDILVMSMNKGQFPVALIGLVVICFVFKMPEKDVSKLVFELLALFKSLHLVGWTLGVVTSIGWLLHSKHQRRMINKEMARISRERNEKQAKLLERELRSSNH